MNTTARADASADGDAAPEGLAPLAYALWQGPAADALLAATVAQGFSPEVALAGLRAELSSWRQDAIERLIADVTPDRRLWPRSVLILAARTLPASAMRQVLLARALGAKVYLKAASGQEALGEALTMADPEVIGLPFTSDDSRALGEAITNAETVVVLGSDATVEAVRARVSDGRGFAGHGHKVSAGFVFGGLDGGSGAVEGHEAFKIIENGGDDEMDGLARDLLAWDQAGCLAPQVVWCEGDRGLVAKRLADAIARCEGELPLAPSSVIPHAAARREVMTLATMLGEAAFATATAVVATHPDSALRSSPGPRLLWVVPFDADAVNAIEPHLSSVVVAGELGAGNLPVALPASVRVCRPGELQRPELEWEQDGLHPLRSLLVPR